MLVSNFYRFNINKNDFVDYYPLVSMYKLTMYPKRYDHKNIKVTGFLSLLFEDEHLYFTKEDAIYLNYTNSINFQSDFNKTIKTENILISFNPIILFRNFISWLVVEPAYKNISNFNYNYVTIVGNYSASDNTLNSITFIKKIIKKDEFGCIYRGN